MLFTVKAQSIHTSKLTIDHNMTQLAIPIDIPIVLIRAHSRGSLDGPSLINSLSNDVHNSAEGFRPHRDLNRGACVPAHLPSNETLGTVHSDGTNSVLPCEGVWGKRNTFKITRAVLQLI